MMNFIDPRAWLAWSVPDDPSHVTVQQIRRAWMLFLSCAAGGRRCTDCTTQATATRYVLSVVVMAIVSFCCTIASAEEPDRDTPGERVPAEDSADATHGWWDPTWRYRQRVTIDAVSLREDLVGFPLRLRFTDGQFARTLAAPDGRDLRIVGAGGTELPFEIVTWLPDDVLVYVRIPEIKAERDTQQFDIYYGNPGAPPAPKQTVWDDTYKMILHLQGDLADAVSGRQDAITREGWVFQDGWTPGLVGGESNPWVTFTPLAPGALVLDRDIVQGVGEAFTVTSVFAAESNKSGHWCRIWNWRADHCTIGNRFSFQGVSRARGRLWNWVCIRPQRFF
jgi:hypothetical protein